MDLEPTTITCPRCGRDVAARFYGPCDECRSALRDTMRLAVDEALGAEAVRFEPKMNVVPNQVAMKE